MRVSLPLINLLTFLFQVQIEAVAHEIVLVPPLPSIATSLAVGPQEMNTPDQESAESVSAESHPVLLILIDMFPARIQALLLSQSTP